ncbi:MAG: ribosome hibernation-promoting factor, HPF/YfiA family [Nocardioides sp.]
MDVVINGRHCEVSDGFRNHTQEKLAKLEKHDHRIIRVSVEIEHQRNPRQADRAIRVELTAHSKGPVIRAEADAADKMGALDLALDKMAAQMRRAADRRRVHRGRHNPQSVSQALKNAHDRAGEGAAPRVGSVDEPGSDDPGFDQFGQEHAVGPIEVAGDGPLVVREKTHAATPMTLDQALYEMELVGHDFYLYVDKASERPSVVYRRRGYDYGVISLQVG